MRRGCITINPLKCDECGATIEHGERYLLLEDDNEAVKTRLCIKCSLEKGYAAYVVEKGEKVLTFLSEDIKPKEKEVKVKAKSKKS